MPILKTDEPKSTSADTSTRRTESSETAIKDIELGNSRNGMHTLDSLILSRDMNVWA